MIRLILLLSMLVFFVTSSSSQTEQMIYVQNHKLFVVMPNGSKEQKSNFEKVVKQFWTLSDTIVFIDRKALRKKKKLNTEELFLIPEVIGPMQLYAPIVPNSKIRFTNNLDDGFVIIGETYLNIASNLRAYLYSINTNSLYKTVSKIEKPILISSDELVKHVSENYILSMKEKYPTLCREASNDQIEQAIISKSKDVFYIYHGTLYSPEDGSRIVTN